MRRVSLFVCALVFAAVPALAQSGTASGPLAPYLKVLHDAAKRNVVEAAAAMPEAEYAFKPTPEVRSFGELIGHIANTQFTYCAIAKGEKNPNAENFEKKTAKADLVKALNDSFAYCDAAYAAATDSSLADMRKGATPSAPERPRGGQLVANIAHNNEHYGNIVTYMRLKGHVPPSTERAQSR